MFIIQAISDIQAPIEKVWHTIVDMGQYHEWNSQLHYVGGTLALGETIHLKLTPLGESGYEFKPKVTQLVENRAFTWLAITGWKGIFDGEHHFELTDAGNGSTQLKNYERYSGLLSPLMKRLPMMKNAQAGFDLMNEEIKKRAERI